MAGVVRDDALPSSYLTSVGISVYSILGKPARFPRAIHLF
jgi:hypothetical protein